MTSSIREAGHGKAQVVLLRQSGERLSTLSFGVHIAGPAFQRAYVAGDNAELVTTDTLKNYVRVVAARSGGDSVGQLALEVAGSVLDQYAAVAEVRIRVRGRELPAAVPNEASPVLFGMTPEATGDACAEVTLRRDAVPRLVAHHAGRRGLHLFKTGGNAFTGFARDEHTTLPETDERPLELVLDLSWSYRDASVALADYGADHERALDAWITGLLAHCDNRSVQDLLYQLGDALLRRYPAMVDVQLRAENHAWSPVDADDQKATVFAPMGTPAGIIELTLSR